MVRLKHYDHDGRARFVTFCTNRRIPVLTNDTFRSVVIQAIDNVRKKHFFRLLGYVIMPEHVHLLIVPAPETAVGLLIGQIKRLSAREIHSALKRSGSDLIQRLMVIRRGKPKFALWQQRCYDHNCRTDEAVIEKLRYCHDNPVKRGLVRSPSDWRWSSFGCYHAEGKSVLEVDMIAAPS